MRVPYDLPELLARPDDEIELVEGEKGVEFLKKLGLLATCVQGQNWTDDCARWSPAGTSTSSWTTTTPGAGFDQEGDRVSDQGRGQDHSGAAAPGPWTSAGARRLAEEPHGSGIPGDRGADGPEGPCR